MNAHTPGTSSPAPRPLPPGGDGLPLIGHGLHLVELGKRSDTEKAPLFKLLAAMHAQHGPVFRLRLPGIGHVVYLEDPELVREVYRLHGVPVESNFPASLVTIFGAAVTGVPHRSMRQTFNALVQKTLQEENRFETMQQMVREEMQSWCDHRDEVSASGAIFQNPDTFNPMRFVEERRVDSLTGAPRSSGRPLRRVVQHRS